MIIRNRFVFLFVGRDYYRRKGWMLSFMWRPRPDLTPAGYLLACRWSVEVRLTLPELSLRHEGRRYNGFEAPR